MQQHQHARVKLPGLVALAVVACWASGAEAQATLSGSAPAGGADLGFGRMIASYVMVHEAEHWTQFGAEPELRDIRPDGPAAGRLREGDILVAVDGALITTRAGSLRLARTRPGHAVRLTIRRAGRNRDVVIVPEAGSAPAPESPGLGAQRTAAKAHGSVETPAGFEAPGSLGLGLACDCSMKSDARGVESWTFREPPEVVGLQAGGPAEGAGVRVGDLIERIGGIVVTTPEGGRRFSAITPGQRIQLGLRRDGTRIDLTLVATAP